LVDSLTFTSAVLFLVFRQSFDWHREEEHARAAGLLGVGVVVNRAESAVKAIPAGKCGFSACGRGPRARERGGGISSECGTSCAGAASLNGQKIKDTRAPFPRNIPVEKVIVQGMKSFSEGSFGVV
jgi:hypothetical protein